MNNQDIIDQLKTLTIPSIKWNSKTKTHDDITVSPVVFERDGVIIVSAEDGEGFADYYGEFTGGYPYIHESLEKVASEHGMYWEWLNPGCIGLYHI